MNRLFAFLTAAAALLPPAAASAANVLFVSNVGGDMNIATVLMADGHNVTIGGDYRDLAGDLSEYEVVIWSATQSWDVPASTFENLEAYVMAGGRVFVTGYDSVISNSALANFCGADGARDLASGVPPGAITSEENSLTTGVVDIRGLTPTGGYSDRDGLDGLREGTISVAPSSSGSTSQWTLRTLGDGEIAFVSNGNWGESHGSWEVTASDGSGAYNAAVRNFAFAADAAMGDPGAPQIEFDAPRTVDEGDEIVINVTIEDLEGDSFTFSWDLDDDGTFGENEGAATYTIPANTTDGNTRLRIGVQAVDSSGNTATRYRNIRINNVAPEITSEPPLATNVGAMYTYTIVATDPGGERDPLTYELVRWPPGMTISTDGVVQWRPGESDVTQPGQTITVEVRVDDGDGGSDSQFWQMTVSPNRVPTTPVPVFPTNMIAVADTAPRLVTENAHDLDLDDLKYFFQIDTVETFDSPELRESGPIDEMPGFTVWQLEEPLPVGRIYYWRVWASDGKVESEQRTAAFYVVPDPAAGPPDAGPVDGGTTQGDASIGPGPDAGMGGDGGGGGGGCSATLSSGEESSNGAGWLWLALLGAAFARRRRGPRTTR